MTFRQMSIWLNDAKHLVAIGVVLGTLLIHSCVTLFVMKKLPEALARHAEITDSLLVVGREQLRLERVTICLAAKIKTTAECLLP